MKLLENRHAWRAVFATALFCISCEKSCTCTSSTLSGPEMLNAAPAATSSALGGAPGEARPVSMVQLLAQPQAFQGARVQVVGFVSVEREGTAIYLHKEDFLQGILPNAVWLDLERALVTPPQKSGYAIVEGRFDVTANGHREPFSGSIDQIDRITPLPSRAESAPSTRVIPPFDAGAVPSAVPRR